MPYVSARDMVRAASAQHVAVAQFNLNNLESIRTFLALAQETHSPLILGVSMGLARKLGGYRTIADTVRNMMAYDGVTVPVALHADHSSFDAALDALHCGFSSVMFDGSKLPIEENLRLTRELAALCHGQGASLEVEAGAVEGGEDGGEAAGELASPEHCRLLAESGADMLAAGIGSMHGAYPPNWKGLNWDLLQTIRQVTGDFPLVLHGGSGIPGEDIRRAIHMGISKINVNSECREAFDRATRAYCQGTPEDPAHMQLITLQPGLEAVKDVALSKMQLFGCLGKA